jgi:hypothetical protein
MVSIIINDMYYQIQKEVNLITHTRLNGLAKIWGKLIPMRDLTFKNCASYI